MDPQQIPITGGANDGVADFGREVERINRDFEERATAKRAEEAGYGYIDIAHYPINPDVLQYISQQEARQAEMIPFYQNGKLLKLAFLSKDNTDAKAIVERLKERFSVKFYLCSRNGFEEAMELYNFNILQRKTVSGETEYEVLENPTLAAHKDQFKALQERLTKDPTEVIVSAIQLLSLSTGASDIHLQPEKEKISVRFRVDGILHEVLEVPHDIGHQIITRIKYDAGMKSNITHMPQDGHHRFMANGREIDVRVSTMPTQYAESIVMRVLDSSKNIRKFSELGFSRATEQKILDVLAQKNGLVLITGPTGSGKTTTIYSMLAELNTPDKKLVTLEDPVEYHLAGVTQSQVDEKWEYNFETGLKAMLRHDPDVILVGEIRTLSTAKLAAEASLTGHIVLSSLHTNNAIGAITRLRNIGMDDFNIAPSVRGIFAQRLIRKVCPHCKTTKPVPDNKVLDELFLRLRKNRPEVEFPHELVVAVGCEQCSQTGYSGMTAICEAILIDEPLHQMILEGQSDIALEHYLKDQTDFVTLLEDGFLKVLEGITTVDEIFRVADR